MTVSTEKVAALFVERDGIYSGRNNVDLWDSSRDARNYVGPWPVVAHPPCERWGRYWSGGPSAKVRRKMGDDGGLFNTAYASVCRYGGVLEHPEASHAWSRFCIPRPPRKGGWIFCGVTDGGEGVRARWTCCVEQGHYGHRARKATWLFAVLPVGLQPPELLWGPSSGQRLDEGFHSAEERRTARAQGIKPRPRLSKRENVNTPPLFAELLISIAQTACLDHVEYKE